MVAYNEDPFKINIWDYRPVSSNVYYSTTPARVLFDGRQLMKEFYGLFGKIRDTRTINEIRRSDSNI